MHTSYLTFKEHPRIDVKGKNVFEYSSVSLRECKKICDSTSNCGAVVYDSMARKCYGKNENGHLHVAKSSSTSTHIKSKITEGDPLYIAQKRGFKIGRKTWGVANILLNEPKDANKYKTQPK